MKFWDKALLELAESGKAFSDVYEISVSRFGNEVFSEQSIGGQTVTKTYNEIDATVKSVGFFLESELVAEPGSFIVMYMKNSPEFVAVFWGLLRAGYRPLLASTKMDAKALKRIHNLAKPACIVADSVSGLPDGAADIFAKTLTASEMIKYGEGHETAPAWQNEIALLTSGTTGDEKIVVYSGKAIASQILSSKPLMREAPSIRYNSKAEIKILAFLPFYHIFGLMATLLWFSFFGRTFVFLNGIETKEIRNACVRHGVTNFYAVPIVWETVAGTILKEAKKQDKLKILNKAVRFSNALQSVFPRLGKWLAVNVLFKKVRRQALGTKLNFLISGGSYISKDTVDLLNGIGYTLHNGYGMTEAGIVSVELSSRPSKLGNGSVGKVIKSLKFKLDENGCLILSGDSLYSRIITKDGEHVKKDGERFVTRDLFRLNKNGALVPKGRSDDIIIGADGENIYPDVVENYYKHVHGIKYVCALGIPDDSKSDKIVILVEFDADKPEFIQKKAAEDLFEITDSLPPMLMPSEILRAENLPVTELFKIKRQVAKRDYLAHSIKTSRLERPIVSRDKSDDKLFNLAISLVKECYSEVLSIPKDEIGDNANFLFDLGGTSLQYYELISSIADKASCEIKLSGDALYLTPRDFTSVLMSDG